MGYLKIPNLYRAPEIIEVFALEKIHGTSASVSMNWYTTTLFSGGESPDNFAKLFNTQNLQDKFREKYDADNQDTVIIYGEAFGGKQQGMGETYGKQLRFMAFDVKINGQWLDVPAAEGFVKEFGIEFVPYERGPLSLPWLDEQRDRPSRVAISPDKHSEGIVIRPIYELQYKDGGRFIFKHKRPEFRETKTPREVDPSKAVILTEASAIADEWVTKMRFMHVIDKHPLKDHKDIGTFIKAMQEDVQREGDGFEWNKDVSNAVGKAAAKMARDWLEMMNPFSRNVVISDPQKTA